MKYLCVRLIRFYQKFISPLKPPSCRFYPTCSEYARQAFLKHGFFWGAVLSAYRILRCNPFCKSGEDPVPDSLFFLRKKKSKQKKNEINNKNERNDPKIKEKIGI
jgi:hypothetical protein